MSQWVKRRCQSASCYRSQVIRSKRIVACEGPAIFDKPVNISLVSSVVVRIALSDRNLPYAYFPNTVV